MKAEIIIVPELPGVPREGGDDAVEALQADRVRAVQQLWGVLAAIVHAWRKTFVHYCLRHYFLQIIQKYLCSG